MALEQFARKNVERDKMIQERAESAGFPDWWTWARKLEKDVGYTICGAPTKRDGPPCRVKPMANGRCKYHGGKSVSGPAHYKYTDGKTSKFFQYLPAHLQDAAQAAYEDERLIQTREQIAVLDAHSKDMLERAEMGESGAAWKQVGAVVQHALNARKKGDEKLLDEALAELSLLARHGVGEVQTWREYRQVVEDIRRQRETELTRMKHLSAFIQADRAAVIFRRMIDIIREHIDDVQVLRLILYDIDKAFGRGAKRPEEE